MTVTNTATQDGPLTPDGVTTAFPFTFRAISDDQVEVVSVLDDVETVVADTDYTVYVESESGGTVAFTTAPLAAVGDLYIRSAPSFEQEVSFDNNGPWEPETVERALDQAAVRDIWLRGVAQAAMQGVAAIAPDVAMLLALYQANGTPFESDQTPEAFGAVGNGITDDSNALEALMAAGGPAWLGGAAGTAVYKVTRQLTGTKSCQWRQHPRSWIDDSALTTGQCALTFTGTLAAAVNISANALRGTQAVTLPSVAGITKGTLLKIVSNAIYDPARTSSKIGELRFARSANAGTGVVAIASSWAEDYNTADTAKVYVCTPLMGMSLSGITVKGSEGGKYTLGVILRLCVEPVTKQASIYYNSNCGIRISDCVGGRTEALYTEINETTDEGYGIVFAHATRGHRVIGHISVMCRHAVTTGNSNTVSFEGIPRDNTYEDFTVMGSQTSVLLAGGAGVDTHCAADGLIIRNGVILNATGPAINIECPNVTVENVVIKACLSHAISLFNISSRDGAYTIRNVSADGCLRGINGQEGFNGATGKVTKVTVDGFTLRNHTQNIMLWNCIGATAYTKLVLGGFDADMSLQATGAGIDITRAASWKSGPIDIQGAGANFTIIRTRDVPIVRTDSAPTLAFVTTASSTGIGFSVDPVTAAFTVAGEVSAIVTASDTGGANAARGVRFGVALRGSLRCRDVQGNCATPYSQPVGAVAVPPRGYNFSTAGRNALSVPVAGAEVWDATLNKPVWSTGANTWKDATGTLV